MMIAERPVEAAFEREYRRISIASIVPLKPTLKAAHTSKYGQILASIQVVGLVEAPVVFPLKGTETFALLDGHLRIQALKALKIEDVACLIATVDDTYTYNRQISKLSPVQDHRMITAAIKRGVPAEALAQALGVTANVLKRRQDLMKGICPEAAAMLSDKDCASEVFGVLKRMKPLRQIEACEFMAEQSNYTPNFVRAMFVASTPDQIAKPRGKEPVGGSSEQMARMERELSSLQGQMQLVESSYGPDVLRLTVIKSYLSELLSRAPIARFLRLQYPEILKEFEKMAEITSLPDTDTNSQVKKVAAP